MRNVSVGSRMALAILLPLAMVGAPAWATVLQGVPDDNIQDTFAPLINTYGSEDDTGDALGIIDFNTPQVDVEWGLVDPNAPPNPDRWFTLEGPFFGYENTFHYAPPQGQATLPSSPISFTAEQGHQVALDSLVAGNVGDPGNVTWRVDVDGTVTDFTEWLGNGAQTTFDFSSTGFGQNVTLQYFATDMGPGAIIFDNLTFSQEGESGSTVLEFVLDDNIQDNTAPLIHTYGSEDDVGDALGITSFATPNVDVEWGEVEISPLARWFVIDGDWELPGGTMTDMFHYAPWEATGPVKTSQITLTAEEGSQVSLDSIITASLFGVDGNVTWRVTVDGTVTDFTEFVDADFPHTFDFSSAGDGEVVTVEMLASDIPLGHLGFDDLTFTQDGEIEDLSGDLNADGFVGGDDLDIVRSRWGQNVPPGCRLCGDPSGDGFVGGDDLDIVRSTWGNGTPPAPTAVPEPATWMMLCVLYMVFFLHSNWRKATMKKSSTALLTALAVLFSLAMAGGPAGATVLQGVPDDNIQDTNAPLINTYGSDDDTGDDLGILDYNTPQVDVEWGLVDPNANPERWFVIGGPILGYTNTLAYAPPSGQGVLPSHPITFSAEEGSLVGLDSLVTANVGATGNITWRVDVDGTVTDFTQSVATGTTAIYDFTSAGMGQTVTLQFFASDMPPGGVVCDNLTFSQQGESGSTVLEFVLDDNIQDDTSPLIHTYGSEDDVADALGITSFATPSVDVEWGEVSLSPPARWFVIDATWDLPGGTVDDGFHYAPFTGSGVTESSEITFTAEEGTPVSLESIVAASLFGVDGNVTWRVNVDGTVTDFTEFIDADTPQTFDFSAAGDGQLVTLKLLGSDIPLGHLVFDDLTFNQVPEPGIMTLLICGLGCLGLIASRRKR